jgi:pimeloyl-ACP methyl ester carboxylesterase
LVRGRRAESPILLKLHGGPGQAEMATVGLNALLEGDFVVVEWDQRGSGKSGAAIQPASAMNVSQLVADTIELTEHLTQRFGRRKLIVVGHSWGSVLGLMAARQSGQVVSHPVQAKRPRRQSRLGTLNCPGRTAGLTEDGCAKQTRSCAGRQWYAPMAKHGWLIAAYAVGDAGEAAASPR